MKGNENENSSNLNYNGDLVFNSFIVFMAECSFYSIVDG